MFGGSFAILDGWSNDSLIRYSVLWECVAFTECVPQYQAHPLRTQHQEQPYHQRRARSLVPARMTAKATSANTTSASLFFMLHLLLPREVP
jgi:hypothetical protein